MMQEIGIREIKNIKIGNAENMQAATGCTVILCPDGAAAGLDVRGGGPASRESELLKPAAAAEVIHAVLLSGLRSGISALMWESPECLWCASPAFLTWEWAITR